MVPLMIDGTGQLYKKWVSTNPRRFVTGLLFGTFIIHFFVSSLVYSSKAGAACGQLIKQWY